MRHSQIRPPGNASLTISPHPRRQIRKSHRGAGHERDHACVPQGRLGQEHAHRASGRLCAETGKTLSHPRRRPAGLAHALALDARRPPAAARERRAWHRRLLAHAMIDGVEWAFIDTAPTLWVVVQEAIRAATLVVIPARPGFFDLAAVAETVKIARERNKPYAVVINAAPVKRDEKEAPAVAASRLKLEALGIPVWSGQISQRAGYMASLAAGFSAGEVAPDSAAGQRAAVVGGRALGRGDPRRPGGRRRDAQPGGVVSRDATSNAEQRETSRAGPHYVRRHPLSQGERVCAAPPSLRRARAARRCP